MLDIVPSPLYAGQLANGISSPPSFKAAALTKKPIFVPEGNYNVTEFIEGYFFSYYNVVVPFIPIQYSRTNISPILTTVKPLEFGGDIPNIYTDNVLKWPGATQGHFCDSYDKILYFSQEQSGGKITMYAVRWSERENERILLNSSPYEFNKFGHQCNSLYRPNPSNKPLFFFPKQHIYKY